MRVLFVALGGALGSSLRYLTAGALNAAAHLVIAIGAVWLGRVCMGMLTR